MKNAYNPIRFFLNFAAKSYNANISVASRHCERSEATQRNSLLSGLLRASQ